LLYVLNFEEPELKKRFGKSYEKYCEVTPRWFGLRSRQEENPISPLSEKTEKVALQALEDHKQGKTKQIDDIDEFLDSL